MWSYYRIICRFQQNQMYLLFIQNKNMTIRCSMPSAFHIYDIHTESTRTKVVVGWECAIGTSTSTCVVCVCVSVCFVLMALVVRRLRFAILKRKKKYIYGSKERCEFTRHWTNATSFILTHGSKCTYATLKRIYPLRSLATMLRLLSQHVRTEGVVDRLCYHSTGLCPMRLPKNVGISPKTQHTSPSPPPLAESTANRPTTTDEQHTQQSSTITHSVAFARRLLLWIYLLHPVRESGCCWALGVVSSSSASRLPSQHVVHVHQHNHHHYHHQLHRHHCILFAFGAHLFGKTHHHLPYIYLPASRLLVVSLLGLRVRRRRRRWKCWPVLVDGVCVVFSVGLRLGVTHTHIHKPNSRGTTTAHTRWTFCAHRRSVRTSTSTPMIIISFSYVFPFNR